MTCSYLKPDRLYCEDFYTWLKDLKESLGDANVQAIGLNRDCYLVIECATQQVALQVRAFANSLHQLSLGLDGLIVIASTPDGDAFLFAEYEFPFDEEGFPAKFE